MVKPEEHGGKPHLALHHVLREREGWHETVSVHLAVGGGAVGGVAYSASVLHKARGESEVHVHCHDDGVRVLGRDTSHTASSITRSLF